MGNPGGDAKIIPLAWGAQGLPWLILTSKDHVVQAEGFNLSELSEKLNAISVGGINGLFTLKPKKGCISLPSGSYHIRYWEAERTDADKAPWSLKGSFPGRHQETIEITKKRETPADPPARHYKQGGNIPERVILQVRMRRRLPALMEKAERRKGSFHRTNRNKRSLKVLSRELLKFN